MDTTHQMAEQSIATQSKMCLVWVSILKSLESDLG